MAYSSAPLKQSSVAEREAGRVIAEGAAGSPTHCRNHLRNAKWRVEHPQKAQQETLPLRNAVIFKIRRFHREFVAVS